MSDLNGFRENKVWAAVSPSGVIMVDTFGGWKTETRHKLLSSVGRTLRKDHDQWPWLRTYAKDRPVKVAWKKGRHVLYRHLLKIGWKIEQVVMEVKPWEIER